MAVAYEEYENGGTKMPTDRDPFGNAAVTRLRTAAARRRRGPGPLGLVGPEEPLQLPDDVVEPPGLLTSLGGEGVPVHGIAHPHHRMPLVPNRTKQGREGTVDGVHAEPGDQSEPPGNTLWVEPLAEVDHVVDRRRRADLRPDRVVDSGEEFTVRTVELPRAFTHPQHVGRAVVPSV